MSDTPSDSTRAHDPAGTPVAPVAADPGALPRPEEEVADGGAPASTSGQDPVDPQDQPAAGGSADGPPAQGDGAADSY